ncbi:unnamed protein product [Rhizoctonia solani]|uniref:Deacetylase sirtuin-type domain-containing protein n=1 Tax=Rhizoctonia solani TaxID=456999 RepID=A0A8H3H7G8_9AGAM|nr:unnamed protein product [Rhizoctonia solani]
MYKESHRNRFAEKTYHLRPAVCVDERIVPLVELDDEFRQDLRNKASKCQVLVIAGTSLANDPAFQLAREMADAVRGSDGAVVFINLADLSETERKLSYIVDYYLQLDVQMCGKVLLELLSKRTKKSGEESGADIWLELYQGMNNFLKLAERKLPSKALPEAPLLTSPLCIQCAITLEDVLFPCMGCGSTYCFEVTATGAAPMCVKLDAFSPASNTLPFEERVREFLCPECFPYKDGDLYPVSVPHICGGILKIV